MRPPVRPAGPATALTREHNTAGRRPEEGPRMSGLLAVGVLLLGARLVRPVAAKLAHHGGATDFLRCEPDCIERCTRAPHQASSHRLARSAISNAPMASRGATRWDHHIRPSGRPPRL